MFRRQAKLSHIGPTCFSLSFLTSWMKWKYVTSQHLFLSLYFSTSCFLDIVLPPKCSPLNQCIHKEPQTLMAIIMLISSTLRCGFNISFRGTSLNSCKLCASGGLRANIKYFMSHSFHSICVCVRDRDGEMYCIITKLKMQAKTFRAPFNLYTNTAKSCTSALLLGWPRIRQASADTSSVNSWPCLTRLFTLLQRWYHFA